MVQRSGHIQLAEEHFSHTAHLNLHMVKVWLQTLASIFLWADRGTAIGYGVHLNALFKLLEVLGAMNGKSLPSKPSSMVGSTISSGNRTQTAVFAGVILDHLDP